MTDRGFSNVAVDAAHSFRSIMQAMARPGRMMPIGEGMEAPEPMLASAAAVALTLCDFQTPIWLAPELRTKRVMHYLRFHTGAPITEEPGKALFLFAVAGDHLPAHDLLLQGTHEYPDRSATLVIQAEGFAPAHVELSGPGIRGFERFGVTGLGVGFWAAMRQNHERFPVGVDVIFTAPKLVAALPRSTAAHVVETA
jgi:alpha-D-ribose 1-methylphosphonate 5-triphosphate synthase subunit PhnH